MTVLIRNALGELKTFMEISAGTVLEPGETMEEIDISFRDYAKKLRLFAQGRSGELIRVAAGSGTVPVVVDCLGEISIDLNINGLVETILLVDGMGSISLSCDIPGMFIITPANRVKYCAAGEAVCTVEVVE